MSDIKIMCSYDNLVDPYELIENPKNPNRHPEKQIEILAKLIKSQGFRRPIVVSNRSGFVTVGHGRLLAAKYLEIHRPGERFAGFDVHYLKRSDGF